MTMTGTSVRHLASGLIMVMWVFADNGTLPAQWASADSMLCETAPRSYANISSLLATPPLATPAATTGGETLERGVPASDAERLAMRAVVEEWLACQNAGKLFSSWTLFSDAYLYRLISRQPTITEALYDDWATPSPTDVTTATLLEMSGERRLTDGRLGATVQITYASVPMPKQFFFYFEAQDGELLIDSILGEISFSVP
jgi:hypothetical protein